MGQLDTTKKYILENDFAQLIPLQEEHFSPLKSISQNAEIWTYFLENGHGEKNFQTYFQNALQQKENQKEYPFAVFDKSKQQYAGMTRLYDYLPNLENIKLGHTWYAKTFQGTGLNKNCKYLLFQFAFEKLKVHRIGFGVHAENIRSLRALKSVGVQKEGILRDFLPSIHFDNKADLVLLSILKKEWSEKVKVELRNEINHQNNFYELH